MNKNITTSLVASALLLIGLFVSACSSNTVQEGVHLYGIGADERREDAGKAAYTDPPRQSLSLTARPTHYVRRTSLRVRRTFD